MPSRKPSDGNASIALIVLAAIGSTLFTLGAGALVYRSTNHLIHAARWVQHTQEVLTTLQTATQQVDRVEANSRLYLATPDPALRDDDQLNAARAAVLRLQAQALRIRGQVADNPGQTENVAALDTCAATLSREVDSLPSAHTAPRDGVFRCRQSINAASEIERKLLQERTEASQSEASLSLSTDLIFAGISLVILSVVFGFLLRDALSRRRIARASRRVNQELALSVSALEDQAEESQLLAATRDELQLCTTLDQLYLVAARSVALLLPGSRGSFGIIDNSRHLVETVSHWGQPSAPLDPSAGAEPTPLPAFFSPSACCGLRSGSLRWRRDGRSEIHCNHFSSQQPPHSYICLPMMAYGEAIGILFVELPTPALELAAEKRLHALAQRMQLISISIASLQLRLKLEQQSIRDPLTGLFNRHFMQISLQKELARARRTHSPTAVFMLDVDHFKAFNDRFGHTAGDAALQSVAAVLQCNLRAEDIVCRYGGEEFLIILPDVDTSTAAACAERIRLAVATLPTGSDYAARTAITISIGGAFAHPDQTDPAELIHRADLALYRAKQEGRNRVILQPTPTRTLPEATPHEPATLLQALATA